MDYPLFGFQESVFSVNKPLEPNFDLHDHGQNPLFFLGIILLKQSEFELL